MIPPQNKGVDPTKASSQGKELEKDLSNFGSTLLDKPFRINKRGKKGNLIDLTTFKIYSFHSGNRGILIYFHDLEQWVNPPTDTNMENNIIKKIDRYGVIYLKEGKAL